MLETLLTLMLLTLPFLITKKDAAYPGLHTGLWISLFMWGRLHPLFSLLIFGLGILFYALTTENTEPDTHTNANTILIHRAGAIPLGLVMTFMMFFCAFGNVTRDLGTALSLDPVSQEISVFMGFAGVLIGPVLSGLLSDKAGPFPAFITFLFLGLASIILTALSRNSLYWFPFGSFTLQCFIGGFFTLMPLILIQFYGYCHLLWGLPLFLIPLTCLWSMTFHLYETTLPWSSRPQDCLLSMTFLLLSAIALCAKAWKHRLVLLRQSP